MNVVVVSGNVCTEPHFWLSRRGKPMLQFVLAVHREPGRPQKADREADFLPVVLAGRGANDLRALVAVRTRLAVKGFMQSRNFTRRRASETTHHTTLEVLAERVELLAAEPHLDADEELSVGDSTEVLSEPAERVVEALPDLDEEDAHWDRDDEPDWHTDIGPVRLREGVVA